MCVCEREGEKQRERERGCVCVREREGVCVCMCDITHTFATRLVRIKLVDCSGANRCGDSSIQL